MAMTLFRANEAYFQGTFSVPQSLFYRRSSAGKEIDFLVGRPPEVVCIESKYAARITGDVKQVIRNSFGEGLIASHDTLELASPFRAMPTALVPALFPV